MKKIRYVVVGLGDIAQEAVLPAFEHTESSELAALVSGDGEKLDALSRKYKVTRTYSYENFEDCLALGDIDAAYIATPNHAFIGSSRSGRRAREFRFSARSRWRQVRWIATR